DEWLSLQVEEGAVEIFQIVESFLLEQRRAAVLEELTMLTKKEEDYRRSRGYFSILSQDDDNEQYIYRLSVLKKFSSSVLFLTADITPEGQTIEHMLYAFAAGVSMI